MKTVVAGAGALGSVIGGYFAQAGADVTLIARKPHVEAIRARGLLIDGMRGSRVVRGLRAVVDPAEVSSGDLLILCVKSQDTHETLKSLRHLRGKLGAAISLQNGGRKDEELAETFGWDAVVGATTLVGATMPEPGRVLHTNSGGTWIGEFDGRPSARVEAIAEMFRKADLPIEVRPDIRTAIWCKLNQMVPASALSCVTRLYIHQLYADRELATLFVELSREVARVGERLGIPLDDFQGFAVKSVCTLPFENAVESVVNRGHAMVEKGMTRVKISTLQDLERGKRTEADQVIGHVVRLAADLGVAVPTLEVLYRVIQGTETALQSPGQGTETALQSPGQGTDTALQSPRQRVEAAQRPPRPRARPVALPPSVSIRPFVPRDLDAALDVINAAAKSYRSFLPPEEYHEPLMTREEFQREADRVRFFVAEDANGEVVGVMGLEPVKDVALVRHGYIRPDCQRQGIGEALLAHLEGLAGAVARIIIGTYRGNMAAQSHLVKHGYRPVADSDAVLRAYYEIPDAQRRGSVTFEKPVSPS